MESIKTNKEYQKYVDKKTPNSPILKNCFNSFWVRWINLCNRAIYNGNLQV